MSMSVINHRVEALVEALNEAENAIICQNLSLSLDTIDYRDLEDNVQNKGRCVQNKGMLFLCALNNQLLLDHGIECFNDKKYIIKVLNEKINTLDKQLNNDIYVYYLDLINGWDAWVDFFNNPIKYK